MNERMNFIYEQHTIQTEHR